MAKKKNDTFTAEDVKRIWNSNSSSQKATETVTSTSPSYIQTSKETYTAEDVKKIWNSSQSTSTRQQTYTPQGHTNNRQQAYTPQTTTQSNRQQAYTPQSYKSYLAQKKNNEKKTTPNYSQTRPFNSAFEGKLPDVPVKDFAENYKKTYSPQEVKTILRNYNAQNVLEKQQKNLNDAIQSGKITQEDLNAAFGNIDDLRNSIKDEHVNIYNEMKQTDPEAAREYISAPRNIMSEADERRADIYKKLKDLGIDADIAEAYYNDQDVATKNYENMTDAEKEQLKNEYESIQNYNVFERYLADGSIENKKEYNRKQELSNNYNKLKNDLTYDYLLKNGMSEDEMEALRQYYTYQSDSDRLAAEGYSNEEIEKIAQDRIDNYEATMAKIYDLFAGTDKFDDITQMIKERYANPQIERDAEEHAIEDSLFTLATNPLESTGAVLGNAYNFISGRPLQNYKTYTNIVRDTTSKNIDSRLGQIVYGGAMSIGDMAVAAAAAYGTGGGSIVSAGIQALEKAAEVINQGVDRGLTPEQIFAEGIGSGVTTYITEKIPMGKLSEIAEKGLTKYTAKEIGKTLASMMITEGAQEGFEDVADWAMDAVVSWDKNEFNEDVQAYIEQGYSKEEAVRKVIADRGIEMLTDVVIGGIGGGVMGGVGSTLAYTTGRIQTSPSIQTDVVLQSDAALNQLIEAVQTIDTTKLSEKDAQRVEHAKEVSQKPSDEMTVEDVVDMSNVVNEQAGPDNNLAQTIQEINYQANYENNINEYLTTGKIEERANELPIERQAREQAQLAVKDFNKAALEQQKQAERNFINELKSYKKNDWQSNAEVKANTEQRLDEASAYFENDTAAKNFKDNYNGQSLDLYTEVSYLAYTAGESGQSFDTFLKNSAEANLMIKYGGVNKGYLKTLFYNGQNARTANNEEVTLRKNENRGKATNLSPDDQLAVLKKAIAKKLNIEVATNFEDAESRGNFMASVARLVTNSTSDNEYATIIHEMFEFARSYNAKGMELVDRTLTDMIVKKKGERSFVDAVNRYKETYRRAGKNAPEGSSLKSEANKTFSEAQEEFVNDAASYIFSTEEGMKNLIDYIMDDGSTTAQEKMSAIQTIKAWVDDLIRAIKNFLSGHPTDQLGYKYTERLKLTSAELQNISQMLVGALEGARANLAAMTEQGEVNSKQEGEDKKAHSISVTSEQKEELRRFADEAYTGKGQTSYKRNQINIVNINSRYSNLVNKATDGRIDLTNKRFAFEASKLYHLIESHSNPKIEAERGQIAYTVKDIDNILEAMINPDIIEDVSGKSRFEERDTFAVAKNINGEYIIVLAVGGKTNPNVVPTEILIFSENKWNNMQQQGKTIKEVVYENTPDVVITQEDINKIKKNRVIAVPYESNDSLAQTSETLPHSPLFDLNISKSEGKSNTESGKTRNSLAVTEDSEGRELSEGQQEYFKDSVVRDDQGRLMVMYHGTPNGDFTVFRGGSYFTNMAWYADRYQNQGASSLGYKKTAKNPKTYAAYLNITKPFDTRDPEIRKIWDEQYYQKWDTGDITENGLPDWTAAEGLREFIEENGLDFDGLIIDEGGVPTDDGVLSRGFAWVPLNGGNQVKDINNLNPTPNKDMRFSLDVPVEETDDLIAIHNMHEDELIKTLKLGGFPMPSIAITKAKMGHDDYGAISVLFRKDTIDPKNWENKVYSGDAYTPEFPQIDFKINENKASKIEGRIRDLIKDIPFVDKNLIAFDTENMEDLINRRRGDVVDAYSNKDAVKNAYLTDKGIRIETPMKEGVIDNYVPNDVMIKLADLIDDSETVNKHDFTYKQYEKLTQDGRIDKFIEILNDYEKKHFKNEKAYDRFHTKEISESRFDLMLKEISEYKRNGIKDQIDYLAVGELVNQKIQENKADYEEWIRDLFDGVIEKQGIRNNKEYISSSGNRRTWNQLHYDYTLDNIIRAMKEEPATGKGLGGYSFLGSATREFESIDDIKSQKDRLKLIDNEEYSKLEKAIADDLNKIAARISGKTDIGEFSAMQDIAEAVAKNKTAGGIKKFLSEWYKVTDNDVAEILALKQRVAELPTGYFEAKPQRAVGLDEVAAVVIPDLDTKLTRQMEQLLNENNIPVVKYKAGDKESRIKAVNSVEDIKFSLKVTDDSLSSLDADYEAAVKSGDIKKAKEYIRQAAEIAFPNSKARNKNGSLKEFYHGTYSEVFNEFDPKMLGTANDTGYFGKGFYFAFNEGEARMYGSNVIPAYLNTVNPFYVEDLYKWNGEKVRDFEGDLDNALFALNFKKTFPKLSKDIAFKIYDKEGNPINYDLSKFEKDLSDVLKNKKFVIEQNTEDGSDYVTIKADKTSENGYDWYEYEKDYAGKTVDKVLMAYDYLVETKYNDIFVSKPRDLIMDNEFSDAVKAMGHDSIFQGREGDEVVLFDSSQIKRSDITYDDNGNLIPLSERFKAENKDIRYSLKVTDTEGRELTKGQQKYFKNSKIVDENGRLKVMYHGSMFAGFTVFDPEASDDKISLFFSDNPEVSRTYTNTLKRFNPDSKWTFETLKDFVYSYSNKNAEAFEENGKIEIENYRTGHTKTFNSVAEAQKYFVDEYLTDSDNDTDRRGIYEVYLNAENPLIVDADGEYWNSLPPVEFPARHLYDVDIQQTSEGTEISYEEDGVVKRDSSANYKTKDGYIDIDAFYNKYGIDIDEQTKLAEHDYLYIDDIFLSKDGERVEEYGKTRDYTKYAKEHGYDSVIFKNIIDYGKYGRDADENVTSDVVVVFNSNQVKSIYNENPTKNEDIRYSIDVSDDGFFDSFLEVDEEVKKTESALKEMIDKRMDLDSDISKKMISDVASYIRNKYNSTYKKEWLESSITAIFKYLQNNNVRMEDIMYIMSDIAKPILENVKNSDPEQEKLYKDIIKTVKSYKIKLDAGQKQEVINAYGSYKNFVDSMRGKITLANDGIALDNIWTELVDKTGGSLSYGTVPNDQPIELANLINGLNPTYASLEGQALEDAAMDVALDIISQFYVHNSMTDAAKAVKGELTKRANKFKEEYKKRYNEALKQVEAEKALNIKRLADEIDNLTAEEQEAIRTGDTVNQVLIENLKKEYKARYERLQAQANEKIARARANYQNSWINKNLRRERSELKNRVLREVKALQNIIAHPQEGASKHVPINLIKPTIEMLEAINLDNGGRNKAIADRLRKMSEVYESFKNDDTYSFDYDERIASDIKELQEMFNNKSYADLGITELQRVIEIVTALKTQIKNANNLILQGKREDAIKMATEAVNEVREGKRTSNLASDRLNKYLNAHLNAKREFRKLAGYVDGAIMKIYNDIEQGFLKETTIQRDLGAIFQRVLEGKENQKEIKRFISAKENDLVDLGITDESGKPIKITRAMRMSLIMHSMNASNMRHVLGSGIKIPDMKLFAQGKISEAYARGETVRFVDYNAFLEAVQRNDQNKINELTKKAQERIENLKNDLSEWEKRYLAASEKMFHEETGKLINKTSMAVKGYALARVKNYFPIRTDSDFSKKDWAGLARDGSIEGMGMLKERVISSKPILLEDITNVTLRQIENVSKYAGYALPMRNFNMVMNTTLDRRTTNGKLVNLLSTIGKEWGKTDTDYLTDLMQDIQGARGESKSFLTSLRGQFAGATLTLNPSVALSQAASYPTAGAVVGFKPLMKALKDMGRGFVTKTGIEELERINPLLWYRNQGNATQDLKDARNAKLPVVLQKGINWIEFMDTGTVRTLEYASMYYVDENYKNLKKGSEEYWQKVSEVFTRVVTETQPNYSTLHRPSILRTPNSLVKMLTMFKTQALQNFNIVYDSLGELNAAKKSDDKDWQKRAAGNFANAVSSQTTALVVFSAIKMLSQLMFHRWYKYRDEDDKWSWEMFLKAFGWQMASTFAGSFLFGSEIFDWIKAKVTKDRYYGIEVSTVEMANDLLSNIRSASDYAEKLGDAKTEEDKEKNFKNLMKYVYNIGTTIGEFTGVPVNNIKNMLSSIFFYGADIKEGIESGDFEISNDSDLVKYLTGGDTPTQYERLYEAFENGDTERYDKLVEELVNKALAENKEEIKAGEMTADDIAQTVQNAVIDKILKLMKADYLEGNVSEEELTDFLVNEKGKTEDDAYMQIKTWEGGTSSEYKVMNDSVSIAAADPTPENKQKVIDEVKGLVEHGKTPKGVHDSLSKAYKEEYNELYNEGKAADLNSILRAALVAAGFTDEEAKKKLEGWLK